MTDTETTIRKPGNTLRVFTEQDANGQWVAGITLEPFASKDIALNNAVAMQRAVHEAILHDLELAEKKRIN